MASASSQEVIANDASAAPVTYNLPDATTWLNSVYHIYKSDSSANAVTVVRAGTDTILLPDAAPGTSVVLSLQNGCIGLLALAGKWVAPTSQDRVK